MRLRIPTDEQMKALLKWGAIRLVLAGGELIIFSWKKVSELSLYSAVGIERIYKEALIKPFNALIWSEVPSNVLEAEVVPEIAGSLELFDWNRFRSEPDTFPHIRIIAKSGMGKTTLARYLMHLLGGKQAVITPKAKPNDWIGLEVYGKGFNYQEIECSLQQIKELMYSNYELIDQSLTPEMANIALDEWRLTKENVAVAGELVKEFITVARDARIRLLALAQGEQVKTWGLEGESDLGECFTDIRLGEFAIDYARKIKVPKTVLDWLQRQKRPCMVDRYPAEVPDLRGYQFSTAASPIERSFSSFETPETVLQSGFQPPENSGNEVPSSAEILLYKAFRAFQGSESDFIKQVWGAREYQLGKSELESLKSKFGG